LRAVLEVRSPWRVSSGSAVVLGLSRAPLDAIPTTAYVMLGERCLNNCAFCAQAHSAHSGADALARVNWPAFSAESAIPAIASAASRGEIKRVCFQVTAGAGDHELAREAILATGAVCDVPVSVSIAASSLAQVGELLEAGAQRVTIALDAATPALFAQRKGRPWEDTWQLLVEAAARYPRQVGTHLIAGLGETEEQFLNIASMVLGMGITLGVFAFTPVRGTMMAGCQPPTLASYRRIQAAVWLLAEGLVRVEELRFDREGRLRDLSMTNQALSTLLSGGEAFRTSGCCDCNRPYYNERPGGPLYNYPRPLNGEEARREIAYLLSSLEA